MPKAIKDTFNTGEYLVFHSDFDKYADEVNNLAFRADNRRPETIFAEGFRTQDLEADEIEFRPDRGDIVPGGAVCVSMRPDVAATFPLADADGRYTPTWIYAFYVKRAILVAVTNTISSEDRAKKADAAAKEAFQKFATEKDGAAKLAATAEWSKNSDAAEALRKNANASKGMSWAQEIAVLTVKSKNIACAFSVSRKPDSFRIESVHSDIINRPCHDGPRRYFAACAAVAGFRLIWTDYVNVGGVLNSEINKRRRYAESERKKAEARGVIFS